MAKVGKILLAIVAVAAVVALNIYAPGIGTFLSAQLGVTVSTALVIGIGSIVISVGFSLLSGALFKPKGADIGQSKVNVRINEPPRYINGGVAMQGGAVVFGEFDGNGDFWYVVIHCDSILGQSIQYYFDDQLVSFDGTGDGLGWCITDDFCLDTKGNPYNSSGGGQRVPYFYVYTQTYTETNAVPPGVAALQTAFPSKWTTIDHLLVGTTYSVIHCKGIKIADRYKIYKWRGPIGLGEPSVSIAAVWSNVYDPRDPSQTLGNRSTYKPSRNAVLVWAWFRTHPFGRNKPESSINWDMVGQQADICDQQVVGIQGTQPRYEAGTAVIDSKDRATAESEIMMACDGQLVFDEFGKTWLRVGYYEVPTVKLTRNRDIISMSSIEAQDGESETQGVIVQYLDPATGYALQSSAPWYNPNYYKEGEGNTFLTVQIETCQNHNQAMRLAKAIGMRSQPIYKLAPTTGLRGLKLFDQRFVDLIYDNTFAGDHEIITPIEVDESGLFCSIGLVPISPDRFDLLTGEEKPKPVYDGVDEVLSPTSPTGVVIDRNNNRIEVTFPPPSNNSLTYQFQYIKAAEFSADNWSDMIVDMINEFAYSGAIDNSEYYVRYRSMTPGGSPSAWSSPVIDVPAVNDGGTAYRLVTQTIQSPLSSDQSSITIAAFSGVLDRPSNGMSNLDLPAGSIKGLNSSTRYAVFRSIFTDTQSPILAENGNPITLENGTIIENEQDNGGSYFAEADPAFNAFQSANNLFIGWQSTSASDGSYPSSSATPSGYGGNGSTYVNQKSASNGVTTQ